MAGVALCKFVGSLCIWMVKGCKGSLIEIYRQDDPKWFSTIFIIGFIVSWSILIGVSYLVV
jgi:hypothetical protein